VKVQVIPRDLLTPPDRAAMLTLLQSQFDGVTAAGFEADLSQKNWVVAIRTPQGEIRAFSTLAFEKLQFEGEVLWIVYSGDTVVETDDWKSRSLAQAWIPAVLAIKRQYRAGPLYWHLLSSGFRTYRFLPALARHFYPRYAAPTPPREHRLMHILSVRRFGADYDPSSGVVRPAHPYVLNARLGGIPPERLADPHIAFFAQANPGHAQGDELVCLARISADNLTPLAGRLASKGLPCEILTGVSA
jgi:hypothetical protein